MNHEFYMQRCLDLAKIGTAAASPNPSVGALLVHEHKIIGEGYTSAYGGAHAEVNCLNNVLEEHKHLISKSSLYVSLEPCSHYGKTPPCSNLIIEKEIHKVIIACTDPNPLVAGKGIKKLKAAGIEVVENILEKQALESNKRFFTFHTKKRPYIILKWAQTPNGFFAPNNNEQFWITNKNTKALVHAWRSQEMGILVGGKTVLADNPRLNTRLVEGKSPIRIVINTKADFPKKLNILDQSIPTIIFNFYKNKEEKNLHYIQIQQEENIIPQVLKLLFDLQISSIIVEGGASTLKQFIDLNLWDEARILEGEKELHKGIKAPKLNGGKQETSNEAFQILKDKISIYRNDSITS